LAIAHPSPRLKRNDTAGEVFHEGASQSRPFLCSSRLYTIGHRPDFSHPTRPHLTSLALNHSLRQHCFDKSILSSALYDKTPRQHPRFVTKAVLSEPQRLQARTNHTVRWPALERHHAAVRRRAVFSFCFIAVARRVKAQGLYMP
jgi:hypothetical protein